MKKKKNPQLENVTSSFQEAGGQNATSGSASDPQGEAAKKPAEGDNKHRVQQTPAPAPAKEMKTEQDQQMPKGDGQPEAGDQKKPDETEAAGTKPAGEEAPQQDMGPVRADQPVGADKSDSLSLGEKLEELRKLRSTASDSGLFGAIKIASHFDSFRAFEASELERL